MHTRENLRLVRNRLKIEKKTDSIKPWPGTFPILCLNTLQDIPNECPGRCLSDLNRLNGKLPGSCHLIYFTFEPCSRSVPCCKMAIGWLILKNINFKIFLKRKKKQFRRGAIPENLYSKNGIWAIKSKILDICAVIGQSWKAWAELAPQPMRFENLRETTRVRKNWFGLGQKIIPD